MWTQSLQRRPRSRSQQMPIDVQQLKMDIDVLSARLSEVQAQLSSPTARSVDSRMSCALSLNPLSPCQEPATPLPSLLSPRHPLAHSMCTLVEDRAMDGCQTLPNRRLPRTAAPIIPPKNFRRPLPAPPKPQRTFAETRPVSTMSGRIAHVSDTPSWSTTESLPDESSALSSIVCDAFKRHVCWFHWRSSLLFLNPFNDLSCRRDRIYPTVRRLASQIVNEESANIMFSGDHSSGKSHICSQLLVSILASSVRRDGIQWATCEALLVLLEPMTSTADGGRMLRRFTLHLVDGRLHRLHLRHCLAGSPAQRCAAHMFTVIATQMSAAEKDKYRIPGFTLADRAVCYTRLEEIRAALAVLCIPYDEVMRVLAACILLCNVVFVGDGRNEVDVENSQDLEDASTLLGVSSLGLYKQLTRQRSQTSLRRQRAEMADGAYKCSLDRDSLVAALYSRLIHSIVRRCNAILSVADPEDAEEMDGSVNDSGIGMHTGATSTITLIETPGLVNARRNSLTELCGNISAEKTRNVFINQNSSTDVHNDVLTDIFQENYGLFALLDQSCDSPSGSHREFESTFREHSHTMKQVSLREHQLAVRHCDGARPLQYDTPKMLERNRNTLRSEIVQLFDRSVCNFKFVSSLFAQDLEALRQNANYSVKASHMASELDSPTFVQDFTLKMDEILHCEQPPIMVHCVKSNDTCEYLRADEAVIREQLAVWGIGERVVVPPERRVAPPLPPPRDYLIVENRRHPLPQRRTMLVDHTDDSSGTLLRAGEAVCVVWLDEEQLEVDTGDTRLRIPRAFASTSHAPHPPPHSAMV